MRRPSWGIVAALSIVLAAGAAAVLALSVSESSRERPNTPSAAYPDDAPFDFADKGVRDTFAEYQRLLHEGLTPIFERCDRGSGEVYRLDAETAMSDMPEFVVVDLFVIGDSVVVDEKKIARTGPPAWRSVRRQTFSAREVAVLRDRASNLLTSRIPAVVSSRPLDSSTWTVQMCRHGRYHFFERYEPDRKDAASAPFFAFLKAVTALRRGSYPGP